MCVKKKIFNKIKVFFLYLKSNNVFFVFLLCLLGCSFGLNI